MQLQIGREKGSTPDVQMGKARASARGCRYQCDQGPGLGSGGGELPVNDLSALSSSHRRSGLEMSAAWHGRDPWLDGDLAMMVLMERHARQRTA